MFFSIQAKSTFLIGNENSERGTIFDREHFVKILLTICNQHWNYQDKFAIISNNSQELILTLDEVAVTPLLVTVTTFSKMLALHKKYQ